MSAPTPEQESALAAMAAGGSVGIAAGAGAGKTTVMVEAVWRDVTQDGVPLEGILIAAYNRAAAAHLVTRLQSRFADPDDGWGRERPGLDLSAAWIGTLHSIAGRIVREHPFVAGVDPEFGELDETEAAALMEVALDQAMAASMASPGFHALVTAAPSVAGLRDATRRAHERLRSAGQEVPRLIVPDTPGPDPSLVGRLEGLMRDVAAHDGARADHHHQLEAAQALILSGEAEPKPPRLALNCVQTLKPLCLEFNEVAEALWQAHIDREAREQLLGFEEHFDAFTERYASLKRERGALDYEDLLLAARRVLRGGVSYDFARVYVDEFQDANALQAELVDLLGAGRTVVVGDGCQAIYGFRHADATHFVSRVGDPPAVTLRDNHRSQEPLLAGLNGLLGGVLDAEPTFAALTPAARDDAAAVPLADPPIEVVDVVAEDGGKATRAQEAEAVADAVAGLIERGFGRRDIAVLFRALTEVEVYRAALLDRGIPVHLVAGRGFFTHDQVADTMALLSLVENPHDEVALVRVLASPYMALGDEGLLELRRAADPPGAARGSGRLWPAARTLAATRPLVEVVDGLRPLLRERGLAGVVEAAISARDYDLAVLGLADGARRYANLRRLVRMAGAHAAVRGPDLRGFLGLLDTMAQAGNQDPGEATLVDPDLDAVRLTTVHGVKGQEFPAVVIADGTHASPPDAPMVIVQRDGTAAIRMSRVGADAQHALGYREALNAAKAVGAAEERRITYVAATRAERHLAVFGRSGQARRAPDGAFTVLDAALDVAGEGVRDFPGGGRAARRRFVAPVAPAIAARPRPEPPVTHEEAAPTPPPPITADAIAGRRLSFTALSTLASCARRFHLEYELGLRGRADASPGVAVPGAASSTWGGVAMGDLVHRALAELDWEGPAPASGWAAAAAAELGLPGSPADAARAERMVADLLASDVGWQARMGVARHAERLFATAVDGALLSGAIDLIVDEGGGSAVVYDWKTHALALGASGADVAADYSVQQALYGLVALRAGWSEVTLRWVVLEDIAGSPSRTVRAGDAPALEAAVRAALAPLRGTGRPAAAATAQPFCAHCPGLDALCPVAGAVRALARAKPTGSRR